MALPPACRKTTFIKNLFAAFAQDPELRVNDVPGQLGPIAELLQPVQPPCFHLAFPLQCPQALLSQSLFGSLILRACDPSTAAGVLC